MKKIIIFAVVLMLLPSAFSLTTYNCTDANTLLKNITKTFTDDGVEKEFSIEEPIYCEFGCSEGRCLEYKSEHTQSLFFGSLGVFIVAFIFAYIGISINPDSIERFSLQFFFLALAMGFCAVNLWVGSEIVSFAESAMSSTVSQISSVYVKVFFASLYALILFIIYFVIKFILSLMAYLKDKKSRDDYSE